MIAATRNERNDETRKFNVKTEKIQQSHLKQ
jgi:hypothetical protein